MSAGISAQEGKNECCFIPAIIFRFGGSDFWMDYSKKQMKVKEDYLQ